MISSLSVLTIPAKHGPNLNISQKTSPDPHFDRNSKEPGFSFNRNPEAQRTAVAKILWKNGKESANAFSGPWFGDE